MKYSILSEKVLNEGICSKSRSGQVHLRENDAHAKIKNIFIDGLSSDALLIKTDKAKVEKIFKGAGAGQNKRCDYVLIDDENMFFIEIKSTFAESNTDEYSKQFKGSLCVVEYIDSVVREFYLDESILSRLNKHYLLLFKKRPIQKLRTSLRPMPHKQSCNFPDAFSWLEVSEGDTLHLSQLP